MIVEPAVVAYNLEVKADVVADIANIAEFGKASDAQASHKQCFPVSQVEFLSVLYVCPHYRARLKGGRQVA